MLQEVFRNSTAGKKIAAHLKKSPRSPIKVAFVDIDATLTGTDNDTATNTARDLLEKKGYIVCFVTNRGDELMMSDSAYTVSKKKYGYTRPPAHFLVNPKTKKRSYMDPSKLIALGLIDPDIISGTGGTKIYWKQTDNGYQQDKSYIDPKLPTPFEWRNTIINLVNEVNANNELTSINPVCFEEGYIKGDTDTYPPDYYIELVFKTDTNKRHFSELLMQRIQKKLSESPEENIYHIAHLGSLTIIEDSYPAQNTFRLFLLPNRGKIDAVDHILTSITEQTKVKQSLIQILLIGDSWADLEMGFTGGKDTNPSSTFLIVGGSRLTPYLLKHQADSPDHSIYQYASYLQPMKQKGFYQYTQKNYQRIIVIGDVAFSGTLGPETIVNYLMYQQSPISRLIVKTHQIIRSLFGKS